MSIERSRFCVNRKIAPSLSIEEFFQVVQKCGLNKVEIRNDMPSGKILDDLTPEQFNVLAKKYNIEVVTINALYPFNLPSKREQVTQVAIEMLETAKAVGAKAVIMCPYNEPDSRSTAQRIGDTADSIQYFTALFAKYGIEGLVEPLGFPVSSLRSFTLAGELIKAVGSPFKMTLDTFHHHLAELPIADYGSTVNINQVGLVHLSGVEATRSLATLLDEDRIMPSQKDVMKSKEQVLEIEKLGYKGIYAFEPFASSLADWTAADVEKAINDSIAYICS
ncbi:2-keto-myo-inositol isomerase [Cricetibacter osteomyelitidis]|uniref:2-keto-myo-inositol isomerase n=1 Tax=Cricetibacter osteomyelitidis TaxID=1521931 RepID=A0A4R2SYZ3_9PAST|nr:TIM barrel protein [Cricetibacter osteomyelitidis]TCP94735.1 2-keto-myo-inositol isomerase [Cricetibacter osteomyelitidis]